MKVQATRQGFYDQVLRDPGEVFELIDEPDGTPPLRMIRTEILKDGKPTGDYTESVYMDAEGNVMHRDFAPDHEELTGRGVFKGDTFSPGWMRQVPDCLLYTSIPCLTGPKLRESDAKRPHPG